MIRERDYNIYKPLKEWIIKNLDSLYFHAVSLDFMSFGVGTLSVEFDYYFDFSELDFNIEHIKYEKKYNILYVYQE